MHLPGALGDHARGNDRRIASFFREDLRIRNPGKVAIFRAGGRRGINRSAPALADQKYFRTMREL